MIIRHLGDQDISAPIRFKTVNRNSKFSREQIALLQGFFRKNHAQCFWSWNPRTTVTDTNAERVLKEARTHGGQEGYQLSALLQKPIAQK